MKMHNYVKQLLEDLETAAANPPTSPYIEFLHDFEFDLWKAELLFTPFKPISEWSGIKSDFFPPKRLLTSRQMIKLFKAMQKVLDSLNIEFIFPVNFPQKRKYSTLVKEWDTPVQYLPQSGFDLSICKDDEKHCPHRRYCKCPDYDHILEQDSPRKRSFDEDDIELPF